MSTRSISLGQSKVVAPSKAEVVKMAAVALTLGGVLVYLAGFAYSAPVHNAAHDTRHSLAFPCH